MRRVRVRYLTPIGYQYSLYICKEGELPFIPSEMRKQSPVVEEVPDWLSDRQALDGHPITGGKVSIPRTPPIKELLDSLEKYLDQLSLLQKEDQKVNYKHYDYLEELERDLRFNFLAYQKAVEYSQSKDKES